MKPPLRECFKSNGFPKKAFISREEASKFCIENKINQKIYKCKFCKKYHLSKKTL